MTTPPSPAAVAEAVEHCRERMKQYWESPDIDRDKLKTILAALAERDAEIRAFKSNSPYQKPWCSHHRDAEHITASSQCYVCKARNLQSELAKMTTERDCWIANAKELQKGYNKVDAELSQARKDVERLDKQLGKFTEVNHQLDRVIDPIAHAAMQQEQKP